MELFNILHFDWAEYELLDVIDVNYVFSSNYQVIANLYNKLRM